MPDDLTYRIRRSDRARRVRVLVDPHEGVEVVLPRRSPASAAPAAIAELRPWIEARLAAGQAARDAVAARGAGVPYLGRDLTVRPQAGRTRVHLRGDELLVPADPTARYAAVERWYRRAARDEIAPRLDDAVAALRTSYTKLTIRNQRTRWGSCSSSGAMSFNWRLLLAPEAGARLRRLARGLSPARHGPLAALLGARGRPLPGLSGAPALVAARGVYIGALVPLVARGRILGGVVVAVVVVALVVVLAGGSDYTVHARFVSASQIVKGNEVKVSGVAVGSVTDVALTDDGHAEITLSIDADGYHPLRRGTRAIIREASLSGVANRYVDLQLGGARGADIPDGGRLDTDSTEAAVDLDQIFDTFDPKTRAATSNSVRFLRDFQAGSEDEANAALRYLNPALSSIEPAVRRGQPRHARLPALRRRDGEARHRRLRPRRRALGPRLEPRDDGLRADVQRREPRPSRSACCRTSCASRTRRSSTCARRWTT